jgi:uncharacterized protein YdeI (YjbR/CyaY-like superfamily)
MEIQKAELPLIPFETFEAWLEWLEINHSISNGLWIKFAKKASGIPSITYEQAREGALMYGWIDGQKGSVDDNFYKLRFTPRRSKSIWSKINCGIVEALIAEGKMKPSGLKEVESAKADGRYEAAYESQSKITVPEDFQKALDSNPKAKEFLNTVNSVNRYAFLYRIHTAKKPETRAARIAKFIEMLKNGEVFYPNKTTNK